MFALDAGGELAEALTIQRLAGERLDLAPKTGTQAVARQARDVDRFDDGASGGSTSWARAAATARKNEDEEEQ